MTWLPAFKVGVWNAWILMLFYPLLPYVMRAVDKAVGTGKIFEKMGDVPTDPAQKRANQISMLLIYVLLAYSIFLPLKRGEAWLIAGVVLYVIGLIGLLASLIHAATVPIGQLFTQGIYQYSRHPMYFSFMIIFISVGIACASWVFLLVTAAYAKMMVDQAGVEERGCLETFGGEYQKYAEKTPKWIGLPKSR